MTPQAWSPPAGGVLSHQPEELPLSRALIRLGHELGVTREQLASAWLMRHPARISPLLGSGKVQRILELVDAEQIVLDRQSWFELLEGALGNPIP